MVKFHIESNEGPLPWWEEEQVKYAVTYVPVWKRLHMITVGNIIRLTDRKFMMHLIAKIKEDDIAQQDRRIKSRKTNRY